MASILKRSCHLVKNKREIKNKKRLPPDSEVPVVGSNRKLGHETGSSNESLMKEFESFT